MRDLDRCGLRIFARRGERRVDTEGRFGMRKKVFAVVAFVEGQGKDVLCARHHLPDVLAVGGGGTGRITGIAGEEIIFVGQLGRKETKIGYDQCDPEDEPMPAICLESQGCVVIY